MQPSTLYLVERGAAPVLLLCVVARVRSDPHQLLVLVTLCTKCEEDVGMLNEETQELRLTKSEIHLEMPRPDGSVRWREKCLPPRAPVISTTPFPLATLPLRAHARRIDVTDCRRLYCQAYRQYARALAQYTENDCFKTPPCSRGCSRRRCPGCRRRRRRSRRRTPAGASLRGRHGGRARACRPPARQAAWRRQEREEFCAAGSIFAGHGQAAP